MRIILLYILLVAFGCQQTTVNGQQTPFLESENLKTSESEKGCEQRAMSNETFLESENLKTSESEKGCEPRAMSHEPFLETENLKTSESEKGCEQRAMSNEQRFRKAQSSQLEAQCLKKTVDYFENQIRLADSLYKNYLPQYNFEEVKAAVMFFDSLRMTTDLFESENLKISETEKGCEQRAMSNETFLESENLKTSKSEKVLKIFQVFNFSDSQIQKDSQVFSFSDSQIQNNVDHHELLKFQNSKVLEFLRARAHYYHAVGLTERDDIVGACEHYFIALEIMESETENLKTSKYRKGSEQRAMSHEQKFRNAHSSKLEAQNTSQFFRGVGMVRATFYIGFTNLVYNMCRLVQIKRYHSDWIIN